jgi:WD40 repeat protein
MKCGVIGDCLSCGIHLKHGLLATGGGTSDRRILLWNINKAFVGIPSGESRSRVSIGDVSTTCDIGRVETGSQVCMIAWSQNVNEIVSAHGYSSNNIVVWKVNVSSDTPHSGMLK